MIYLKSTFIGFGTVLFGLPIAGIIWAISKSQSGGKTISFSLLGLTNHLSHSLDFWALIIALFTAGFLPSVFLLKK